MATETTPTPTNHGNSFTQEATSGNLSVYFRGGATAEELASELLRHPDFKKALATAGSAGTGSAGSGTPTDGNEIAKKVVDEIVVSDIFIKHIYMIMRDMLTEHINNSMNSDFINFWVNNVLNDLSFKAHIQSTITDKLLEICVAIENVQNEIQLLKERLLYLERPAE